MRGSGGHEGLTVGSLLQGFDLRFRFCETLGEFGVLLEHVHAARGLDGLHGASRLGETEATLPSLLFFDSHGDGSV